MGNDDTKYNGYANYPTWNVALWISNDEPLYRHWQREAQALRETPETYFDGTVRPTRESLADVLQAYFEESMPDEVQSTMWGDLLSNTLARVDWREVADSVLGD